MIEDVHFDPEQIKQFSDIRNIDKSKRAEPMPLAGDEDRPPPAKPDNTMFEGKSRGGKRPGRHARGRAWAKVFDELVRLRDAGELSETHFKGRERLIYHLTQLSHDPLYSLKTDALAPLIAELMRSGTIVK